MHGITAEQVGRAVGMRLALALLADMQRKRPGGRYPERAVRARAAAALRDEQEAWAADGPPLPEAARAVALRTMMDLLEAVIDRRSAPPGGGSRGAEASDRSPAFDPHMNPPPPRV